MQPTTHKEMDKYNVLTGLSSLSWPRLLRMIRRTGTFSCHRPFAYRTVVQESTGFTPFLLTFGQSPNLPIGRWIGQVDLEGMSAFRATQR